MASRSLIFTPTAEIILNSLRNIFFRNEVATALQQVNEYLKETCDDGGRFIPQK